MGHLDFFRKKEFTKTQEKAETATNSVVEEYLDDINFVQDRKTRR